MLFTTLVVQPIFNLLVLIYALLPGHNFGLAIIVFTIIVRILLWPLIKKQLHQAKIMRVLQPELRRIKQATKGDRQKQQQMQMELFKERGINPLAQIGVVLLQLPILLGLYYGVKRVVDDPNNLLTFSYEPLRGLPWLEYLADNIKAFDSTLFGVIDLTRSAINDGGGFYLPALLLVFGSAAIQYFTSKQLMPDDKDARNLRTILKEAGGGNQADQSEMNAAITRSTRWLLPIMIFVFSLNFPSALGLYWLVGGLVAYIQNATILNRDEVEMEALADKPSAKDVSVIPEAEVVPIPVAVKRAKAKAAKKKRKKR